MIDKKQGLHSVLYYWQRSAVYLLVNIKRKDVGHAAYEVNHRHNAGSQAVAVNVVLTAYTAA